MLPNAIKLLEEHILLHPFKSVRYIGINKTDALSEAGDFLVEKDDELISEMVDIVNNNYFVLPHSIESWERCIKVCKSNTTDD